jgi:hypothetical protein
VRLARKKIRAWLDSSERGRGMTGGLDHIALQADPRAEPSLDKCAGSSTLRASGLCHGAKHPRIITAMATLDTVVDISARGCKFCCGASGVVPHRVV